jgi:hypothetical protein
MQALQSLIVKDKSDCRIWFWQLAGNQQDRIQLARSQEAFSLEYLDIKRGPQKD